jgi:hypothetical protein
MSIKDYGKLARLTITSVNTGDTFEVMFNPESYSEKFAVAFQKVEEVNGGLENYRYAKTPPQDFKLKFIMDGTGVTDYESSVLPVFKRTNETVYDQINHFLKLAWYPVDKKAIPLKIEWGKLSIHCLLKDVTINYTLFDREGVPLRAELDANFMSDPDQYESDCENRLKPNITTTGTNTTTSKTTSTSTKSTKTTSTSTSTSAKSTKTSNSTSSKSTTNGIVISVS